MHRFTAPLVLAALLAASPAAAQNPRVVNGRIGAPSDLRATVALVDPEGGPICTGTLIAPDVVVTAGHCVANEVMTNFVEATELLVSVGRMDIDEDFDANVEASFEVASVHPACGYLDNGATGPGPAVDASGLGRSDDIAFLRLAREVPAAVMTPIPILPAARRGEITYGTALTVTGYGIYDLDTEAGGLLHTGETRVHELTDYEVMTTRDDAGASTDSCYGDSGGPLYYTDPSGETFLVGVTSRGPDDSDYDCGDGGIYVRASMYPEQLMSATRGEAIVCDDGTGEGPVDDYPPGEVDEIHDWVCADICYAGSPHMAHALCRACGEGPTTTPEAPPACEVRGDPPMEAVEMSGGCSAAPGRGLPASGIALGLVVGLALWRRRRA